MSLDAHEAYPCIRDDVLAARRFGKSLARVIYQGLGVSAPRSVFHERIITRYEIGPVEKTGTCLPVRAV